MIVQLSKRPKAWINTLVLAGMTVFVPSARAQEDLESAVNADAITFKIGDAYDDFDGFGDFEPLGDYDDVDDNVDDNDTKSKTEVAQVGFVDDVRKGMHGMRKGVNCAVCKRRGNKCCCRVPWWAHGTGGFGQFLLLRPGNVDQIYAIEQNDSLQPGVDPTGPIGRVNVDDEAGYRVGLSLAASDCTSLVASYTDFDGNTSNQITATAGNFLNSLIYHPNSDTVGDDSLVSAAEYSIDFQLFDLAYRHIWKATDTYAINWLAGFRYGEMGQELVAEQLMAVATGLDTVNVDVDFNGFGMMFGVDGERRSCQTGLMIYGRGVTSFLAGDWEGSYAQVNQFGGGIVANEYEDYRVTPVVELELGLGWASKCGRCRATAGYMTSAWYDAISTRSYVDAVRNTNYIDVDETITFSGLTTGIEVRF
jgi:hypothetical protein